MDIVLNRKSLKRFTLFTSLLNIDLYTVPDSRPDLESKPDARRPHTFKFDTLDLWCSVRRGVFDLVLLQVKFAAAGLPISNDLDCRTNTR